MAPDNSTHRWINFYFEEELLPNANLTQALPLLADDVVSLTSVRDPIGRIFSGDGMWKTTPEGENMDKCNTDNYGLRKIIGKRFNQHLTWEDVEFAKRRLERFDVVLDQGDFVESSKLLCAELGWSYCGVDSKPHRRPEEYLSKEKYDYLVHKNRFELAFYKYAQELVQSRIRESKAAGRFPDTEKGPDALKHLGRRERHPLQPLLSTNAAGKIRKPLPHQYWDMNCPGTPRKKHGPQRQLLEDTVGRRAWICFK